MLLRTAFTVETVRSLFSVTGACNDGFAKLSRPDRFIVLSTIKRKVDKSHAHY